MTKKDVFQEDKFGVRFFIYNRKKYFVVNDLSGSAHKNSLKDIERYLKRDPQLKIFGYNKNDAKPPKFCLSFARLKILNKKEIKEAIEVNNCTTLSEASMKWLFYHKINVVVKKRINQTKPRESAEVLYRKVLKQQIATAVNHITENREIV